jgi:uncharacterized lipoprotein YddW (UPF0748 family)
MTGKLSSAITGLCLFLLIYACSSSKSAIKAETIKDVPRADREFRAAWVATVANINWPSKPGLSTKEQQDEAISLLDFLQQNHFNAVILQVRPQCDALYKSDLEPWSYYLTGQQGKAPDPYYDPLQFWIEAAHDRGLELHVWLNPYRAHHKDGKEISDQSIVKTHPELVMKLKEGYWWMDPAMKGTQDHTTDVIMDIVKRYDIDGVHFDDYFYPYPSYNGNADFPDSASWTAYQQSGGKLSRGDWRREAVNKLIERLYKNIKAEKPYVKFGVSPFGIWRPGYPESISGFDQYDQLYADAKLWLNKGWVDYFSPQLYWPINRIAQSFPVLLNWWEGENTKHRHLWPGISIGRDTSAKNVNEILSQLMITRGALPQSKGLVHWSISSLTKNPNMVTALVNGPYKKQALVPASPWLDKKSPAAPTSALTEQGEDYKISWAHTDEKDVFHWIVYYKDENNNWRDTIMNRNDRSLLLPKHIPSSGTSLSLNYIAVTAVDRTGNESIIKKMGPAK